MWSVLGGRDAETVDVPVHLDAGGALDKLAVAAGLPEGDPHVLVAMGVVVTHHLLDGLGGLAGVVEGDPGHVVVQDVGLDDVVEEEGAHDAKLAVDGGGGSTGKVPLVVLVVRKTDVGVLEVGDEHQPVVCEHVGEEPVHEAGEPAKVMHPLVEDKQLGEQSDVREHNEPVVSLLENRRRRVEVRLHQRAVPVVACLWVRLARHVGEQVPDPAAKLLQKQLLERHERRVGSELRKRHHVSVVRKLLSCRRNKHHVSRQVPRGLVVLPVRVLPREVWHHEVRVQHPSDRVVDPAVVRERLVAALVRHDPEPRVWERLQHCVAKPPGSPQVCVGQQRDALLCDKSKYKRT